MRKKAILNDLVKALCTEESGKESVSVGNMREILKDLSDILWQEFSSLGTEKIYMQLLRNGQRRARKDKLKKYGKRK